MFHQDITVEQVFTTEQLDASGTITSNPIDLGDFAQVGRFALQLATSTAGATIEARYQLSNDDRTYYSPTNGGYIVYGFWNKSGPNSDGEDIIPFAAEFGRFMKILITEVGASTGTSITAKLAIQ